MTSKSTLFIILLHSLLTPLSIKIKPILWYICLWNSGYNESFNRWISSPLLPSSVMMHKGALRTWAKATPSPETSFSICLLDVQSLPLLENFFLELRILIYFQNIPPASTQSQKGQMGWETGDGKGREVPGSLLDSRGWERIPPWVTHLGDLSQFPWCWEGQGSCHLPHGWWICISRWLL